MRKLLAWLDESGFGFWDVAIWLLLATGFIGALYRWPDKVALDCALPAAFLLGVIFGRRHPRY